MLSALELQSIAVPDFCFSQVFQLNCARDIVFVTVGFKDIANGYAFLLSKLRVDFAVASWVNYNCFAFVCQEVAVVR